MPGYLIDGSFIMASEIAAIEFLKQQGTQYFKCADLAEFNGTGENARAIQITLKSGAKFLFEHPKSIKRDDAARLLV